MSALHRRVVAGLDRVSSLESLERRLLLAGGDVDTTYAFGVGALNLNFVSGTNDGLRMALQADGKTVTVGTMNKQGGLRNAVITRHNAKGKFDTLFGTGGTTQLNFGDNVDDIATSVAIVPSSQKIVITGVSGSGQTQRVFLARFHTTGLRDKTFLGGQGFSLINSLGTLAAATQVIIEPGSEKILICGATLNPANLSGGLFVARFNTNGTPDTSFGTNGIFTWNPGANKFAVASTMYAQKVGKTIVGFVVGGAVVNVTLFPSPSVTSTTNYIGRVRFDGKGLDTSFGTNGAQTHQVVNGRTFEGITCLSPGPSNQIFAGGYTANGLPEFGTGFNVGVGSPATTISDFSVLNYTQNGQLDNTFSGDGRQTVDFSNRKDGATGIAVQSDGVTVVGASGLTGQNSQGATARLKNDGSLDSGWGTGGRRLFSTIGGLTGSIGFFALLMLAGGRMYVTGHRKTAGTVGALIIMRLILNSTLAPFSVKAPAGIFATVEIKPPDPNEDLLA